MSKKGLYKGNFPDPEFYRFIGRFGDWKMYASRIMKENGHYQLKVVSLVPRMKANLYLIFSLNLGRMVKNKNAEILAKYHPEDFKGIEEVVKGYFMGEGMKREDEK